MDYYLFQAGRTALMLACKGGQISVVEYLEAQGADVNVKDGVSPLLHLKLMSAETVVTFNDRNEFYVS